MASSYHADWQSSKRTVFDRNTYMFDNALMSDISFTCGESNRVFHAHKYVLGTSSAVFYAMFYGDLAEKVSTICIPDVEEDSFQEFLRFLYTDDCKDTEENAIRVMYLAKKYLISPALVEKCCEVLQKSVKPGNVFEVLEQAIQFDEKELEAKCWDIVSRQTMKSLNTEEFCSISSRTLKDLLKRNSLQISEADLFKGILKWVDSECERQGINIEEDNAARRRILGESVYEIRFFEMSPEDFAKYVPSAGILTEAEIVPIFQKFGGLVLAGLKWKNHDKRRCLRIVSFCRFDSNHLISWAKWNYDGSKSDALAVVVNKAVLFHGVRLFGDSNGSQYEVKFWIKDESATGTYTSELNDQKAWGYDVMLPKPIPLLPDEEFTICATIKGPTSDVGCTGKSSVKVDDITVTFENVSGGLSSYSTDKDYGQFYKIFLSKL